MKIKQGDTIEVIAGNDKGRRGEVIKALPQEQKVVVDGIHMVRKHTEDGSDDVIEKPMPIDVSNVMLVDPESDTPTRVGYTQTDDGNKVRIAKDSGARV